MGTGLVVKLRDILLRIAPLNPADHPFIDEIRSLQTVTERLQTNVDSIRSDVKAAVSEIEKIRNPASATAKRGAPVDQFAKALKELRAAGYSSTGLVTYHLPQISSETAEKLADFGVNAVINIHPDNPEFSVPPLKAYRRSEFAHGIDGLDSLINIDPVFDAPLHSVGMSRLMSETIRSRKIPIAFADIDIVVSGIEPEDSAAFRANSAILHYLIRSALKGHFVEFGTWFGRGFFHHYHLFKDQLAGKFWAFDSFGGLSKPNDDELKYSGDMFEEGSHFCNLESFDIIGQQAGIDATRLERVPGFYDQTLRVKTIADYQIEPKSISICLIDCDLYEPTLDVLEFVHEGLDDGALLYFDDLRLARAANKSGEYDAMRRWLKKHPEIELIPFPTHSWEAQWYIFNRYTEN